MLDLPRNALWEVPKTFPLLCPTDTIALLKCGFLVEIFPMDGATTDCQSWWRGGS